MTLPPTDPSTSLCQAAFSKAAPALEEARQTLAKDMNLILKEESKTSMFLLWPSSGHIDGIQVRKPLGAVSGKDGLVGTCLRYRGNLQVDVTSNSYSSRSLCHTECDPNATNTCRGDSLCRTAAAAKHAHCKCLPCRVSGCVRLR